MKSIINRLYADFLLPNRMEEYKNILQVGLDQGYTHLTIPEFGNMVKSGNDLHKIAIHRHDIDTDVKTARRFYDTEQQLNIKSSYYFRLSTIDVGLMREIHAYGSDVGYHFEEIADYCKDYNIHSWREVSSKMKDIQKRFEHNFLELEHKLGFKINTVVSHGDFVNRLLKHTNTELLSDELREELGIDYEGYDPVLVDNYNYVQSDKQYPQKYREPKTPEQALNEGVIVMYLLTHPRHWYCSPLANMSENWRRFKEGKKYKA